MGTCKRGHHDPQRDRTGWCLICRKAYQQIYSREYFKKKMDSKPPVTSVCEECSKALTRRGAKFCSAYCRQCNWDRANPEAAKIKRDKFRAKPYGKFVDQRQSAIQRGIDWKLSFDDWLGWWGDDLKHRHGATGLMMLRFKDEGPYALDNIYKGTAADNIRDTWAYSRGRTKISK